MDWDNDILELYENYNSGQYSPNGDEWELLSSTEYAFYEAFMNFPEGQTATGLKIRNVRGWFNSALGGDWNTSVTDWICELTQNAFDRNATKCYVKIDNENRKLNFGHNGLGIQGPITGGQLWGDVIALIEMGISLKNYDLHSEGRFGVGFKYWMKHFNQVILTANNLRMGWTKAFKPIEPSRKKMKDFKDWTLFEFSGPGEGGTEEPLEIQVSDLQRLNDAIRMRTKNFELEVKIDGGGNSESFVWEHKITPEYESEGLQILSCQDQHNGEDTGTQESTLMLIPANSNIFPEGHVTALTEDFFKTMEKESARRKDLKEPEIEGDPSKIIQKYFSEKPLVLGFFHGEGEIGSILSMFPISNEGNTSSRLSFAAPFEIEPTRLELKNFSQPMLGPPERNRILIQMMIHSYGQFLKIIQNENIIDEQLIQFVLENPPGQNKGGGEELDEKIREYATNNYAADSEYSRAQLEATKVFNSHCWPTRSGLYPIGDQAKQLDPLLIDYRINLLDDGNIDDLQWLAGLLEDETIIYGEDQHNFSIPVCNWITKLLSQEKGVGYSGIDVGGGNNNAP